MFAQIQWPGRRRAAVGIQNLQKFHSLFYEGGIKLTESGVEVALWHLAHVVLVQELALVALLAEAAQPVLAHDRLRRLEGGEPVQFRNYV